MARIDGQSVHLLMGCGSMKWYCMLICIAICIDSIINLYIIYFMITYSFLDMQVQMPELSGFFSFFKSAVFLNWASWSLFYQNSRPKSLSFCFQAYYNIIYKKYTHELKKCLQKQTERESLCSDSSYFEGKHNFRHLSYFSGPKKQLFDILRKWIHGLKSSFPEDYFPKRARYEIFMENFAISMSLNDFLLLCFSKMLLFLVV